VTLLLHAHRSTGAVRAAGTTEVTLLLLVLPLRGTAVVPLRAGAVALLPESLRVTLLLTGTARTHRAAGARGKLRGTTHRSLLLVHRLRSGYGRGPAGPVLRLRFTHVLLILRRGSSRGGQLGAQVLVLAKQASQFSLDLIEEGIDLVLVVAFAEPDGRELLVPHVLGGQRHLFTST
jgi:hypothetical protein